MPMPLPRGAVGRTLVDRLFLGVDPMGAGVAEAASVAQDVELPIDGAMTHVSARDIDLVLSLAVQPVTFWLELGAFEGGSAILTAERAKVHAVDAERTKALSMSSRGADDSNLDAATTVVAVDTFLGDTRTLWERPPKERRRLLRPDGSLSLYDRFRANVRRNNQVDAVLPLPATSIVALRLFAALSGQGVVPAPQVVYLDSAHEEGEVLLEMQLAWKVLAPGGIMFGDDWVLPPSLSDEYAGNVRDVPGDGSGGAVQRDVLRFAEAHQAELEDELGQRAHGMRTLGRTRPGLFVSYLSFQWFMQKRLKIDSLVATSMTAPFSVAPKSSLDCWSDGFDSGDCCDEAKFGLGGNPKCWDLMFTFEQCCTDLR